jgi:hypothetical protein
MNFLKNNLRTLVLVALFSASIFMAVAGGPENISPPSGSTVSSDVDATIVAVSVASIPVNIVNDETTPILYAGTPVCYTANLATNTVTEFSSVCSFTVPCVIKLNARGALWTGAPGAASATVQNSELWASGEKQTINPGAATFSFSMIAATTATCPMSITIVPLIELAP